MTGASEETADRRIPLPWLVTPIVVLSAAGWIGDIVGLGLVTERPLLQMFLNPRIRYLVLASPQVEAVPFFVVGFARLVLTDPIFYLLGLQYGDGAMRWAADKMGDGGTFVRTASRWFNRAAPLVILVAPSGYLCLLAGFTRMSVRVFVAMNVIGTIGRLVLIRLAGEAFEHELNAVLDFLREYRWWAVAISFAVVMTIAARAQRRGALETPSEIEREIEEAEEEIESGRDHPQP